jgi:hypothetical protein
MVLVLSSPAEIPNIAIQGQQSCLLDIYTWFMRHIPTSVACSMGRSDLLPHEISEEDTHGDFNGWTALHWAVNNRHPACVKYLLQRRQKWRSIDPMAVLARPWRAIVSDLQLGDEMLVVRCPERGLLRALPKEDVWKQAECGDVLRLLQCLERHRPSPYARGAFKRTPLHWACASGHAVAAAFLLLCVPVSGHSYRDFQGNTPLHLAVINSHSLCLQAIIDQPLVFQDWMRAANDSGEHPLHLARDPAILEMLVAPLPRPLQSNIIDAHHDWRDPRSCFRLGHLRELCSRYDSADGEREIQVIFGMKPWSPQDHRWFFPDQQRRIRTLLLIASRSAAFPTDLVLDTLSFLRNE